MVDKNFPQDFTDATAFAAGYKILSDDGAENKSLPFQVLRDAVLPTIADAGVPVTKRPTINFGTGFTVTDDGANTRTNVAIDVSDGVLAETVLGSAQTSITVTLPANTVACDVEFYVPVVGVTSSSLRMQMNGDTTETNYRTQFLRSVDATTSGNEGQSTSVGGIRDTYCSYWEGRVRLQPNGNIMCQYAGTSHDSATQCFYDTGSITLITTTSTAITQVTMVGAATTLPSGTKLIARSPSGGLKGDAGNDGATHVIQQSGSNLPQRQNLNFVGAEVQDDPINNRTTVTVNSGNNVIAEVVLGSLQYDIFATLPAGLQAVNVELMVPQASLVSDLQFSVNGDLTHANYVRQYFSCIDTTVTAGEGNARGVGAIRPFYYTFWEGRVRRNGDGTIICNWQCISFQSSTQQQVDMGSTLLAATISPDINIIGFDVPAAGFPAGTKLTIRSASGGIKGDPGSGPLIQNNGSNMTPRGKLNFAGTTLVDDPVNDRTNVIFDGGTNVITQQTLASAVSNFTSTFPQSYSGVDFELYIPPLAAEAQVRIHINGNTTDAEYARLFFRSVDTATVVSYEQLDRFVGGARTTYFSYIEGRIRRNPNGTVTCHWSASSHGSGTRQFLDTGSTALTTTVTASLTSLGFDLDTGNFPVGTCLIVRTAGGGLKGDAGPGLAAGGTTGQFARKLSNADFDTEWVTVTPALIGAAAASHGHVLADVTDVTVSAANLNILDDGGDTTLHYHSADRSRANHTGTQTASTISDFSASVDGRISAASISALADVDTTGGIALNDVLKYNGTDFVPGPDGSVELRPLVLNQTGATIPKRTPVFASGFSNANGGTIRVSPVTLATSTVMTAFLGLTTEDIVDQAYGYVQSQGYLRNVDTSSLGAGLQLFITETGGLSTTSGLMCIGRCLVSNAVSGTIYMHITREPGFTSVDAAVLRNGSGTTIPAKTLVRQNVSGGAEAVFTVYNTDLSFIDGQIALGITAAETADGAYTRVVRRGLLHGVDTSMFGNGDILFANNTGALISPVGDATDNQWDYIYVGRVVGSAVNGTIDVNMAGCSSRALSADSLRGRCTNLTGTTIPALTVVRYSGAASRAPRISPVDPADFNTLKNVAGVTTRSVVNTAAVYGLARNGTIIGDFSAYTVGAPIYIGAGGALSSTGTIIVGYVLEAAVIGQAFIDVALVQSYTPKYKSIVLQTQMSSGAIPPGAARAYVTSPFAGTIRRWFLASDAPTVTTLDIWKLNEAIPTNSNSITASAKPSLSSSSYASSTTLTGWTTAIAVGDVIELEVESNSSATSLTLTLEVEV